MKRYTLDSSVGVLAMMSSRKRAEESAAASDLCERARYRELLLIEPPTWYADIVGQIVRRRPRSAAELTSRLLKTDAHIDDTFATLERAVALATQLRQKLADTFYHAVALEQSTTLITANERYFRSAHRLGRIMLLSDWRTSHRIAETRPRYAPIIRKRPQHWRRKR